MIARGTRAMRNIGVTYEMTARADTHSKVERLRHSRVAGMCCTEKNKHTESSVTYQVLNSFISFSFLPLTEGKRISGFETLKVQLGFEQPAGFWESAKGFLRGCFACLHCVPQPSCRRITDGMWEMLSAFASILGTDSAVRGKYS